MTQACDSLKLLFWVAPITEMGWPQQKKPWIEDFIPRVQDSFRKIGYDIATTVIVSEDLLCGIRKSSLCVDGDVVAFGQGELLGEYRYNALDEFVRYQETHKSSGFFYMLGELVRGRLGANYRPDVVISFSPSPFFNDIYPNALLLYHEYGIFSRKPYPRLYYFDPYGVTSRNFAAEHSGEINAVKPESDMFLKELDSYRAAVRTALLSCEPAAEYFADIRRRYSKLLLVPLGYEGFADARVNFKYQTQFEYVEHILDVVDNETAVVLTQHPACKALRDDAIASLKDRYGNLFHEQWYLRIPGFSQVALPYCDACITQSSSLAYQTVFLQKRLVSVGGFCGGIADGHCVEDLRRVFMYEPKNRENFLVWTLRNHSVDVEDLPNHLGNILQSWLGRSGVGCSVENWPSKCTIKRFERRLERWKKSISTPPVNSPDIKVYFNLGDGFSEMNRIRWKQFPDKDGILISKTICLPAGCVKIRFDPFEVPPIEVAGLRLLRGKEEIPILSHNGIDCGGSIVFIAPDPQIAFNIPHDTTTIELSATLKTVDPAKVLKCAGLEIQRFQRSMRDESLKLSAGKTEIVRLNETAHLTEEMLASERERAFKAEAMLAAEQNNVASLISEVKSLVDDKDSLASENVSLRAKVESLSEMIEERMRLECRIWRSLI